MMNTKYAYTSPNGAKEMCITFFEKKY